MKKTCILLSLALVLCIGLGATSLAEANATPAAPGINDMELLDGPLELDPAIDAKTLLTSAISLTYKGDPDLIIGFDIATEKGAGEGEIGTLKQLLIHATEEVTIDGIRYGFVPAEDNKSLTVAFEFNCTTDGKTQQFTDTLTLTPGTDGEASLVVVSENGGEAVPTNG